MVCESGFPVFAGWLAGVWSALLLYGLFQSFDWRRAHHRARAIGLFIAAMLPTIGLAWRNIFGP